MTSAHSTARASGLTYNEAMTTENEAARLAAAQARLNADLYDENGIDLSLIRLNMQLSPTERARRGELLRRAVVRVAEIGRGARQQSA